MDVIFFMIIGGVCFVQGYNAYTCKEQTKVFNKINLPLKDVQEYNHFCGKLIYGFGIGALLIYTVMVFTPGWGDLVCAALLVLEAYALVKLYSKNEKKFIKQY